MTAQTVALLKRSNPTAIFFKAKAKIHPADRLFSLYVRTRDKWQCQRCKRFFPERSPRLHCSHFYGRGKFSVRFDPDNCIALCAYCHFQKWGHGDEHDLYEAFMKKKLGEDGFKRLTIRAYQTVKHDWTMAKFVAKALLDSLKTT